jgi:hypothetical protein
MQTLTITDFRKNIYQIADSVIKSGTPKKIKRKGHTLKIVLEGTVDKLSFLKPHNTIIGDPDELIGLKVGTWQEPNNV